MPKMAIPCPDCGGSMTVKRGRYGLFFGCENFNRTLCRGSISADRHGNPAGIPGDKETRTARRFLFMARRWLMKREAERARADEDLLETLDPVQFVTPELLSLRIGYLGKRRCRKLLKRLILTHEELGEYLKGLPDPRHLTRWERIVHHALED